MRTGRLETCVENEKWRDRAGLTGVFSRHWRAKRILHKEGWIPVGWDGGGDIPPYCTRGTKRARRREGHQGWPVPGLWGMAAVGMLLNLGEVG